MENVGQASLVLRSGPNSGLVLALSERPFTLGRRSENDMVLDESTVSRRHALIMKTAAGYVLRDLNSKNGTYVNGDKIGQVEHLLRAGDRIRLASSEVTAVFRQEAPATVPMSRDPPTTSGIDLEGRPAQQPQEAQKPISQLSGKEAELFKYLESRTGVPVSREDVARYIWPELPLDHVLGNQEIEKSVALLRADLEDDPRNPVHLITVGEYGYLLIEA